MLELFRKILEMSAAGAVAIAAVILLRAFMRKLPRKYVCFLWIIPAIRLICPVTIASVISIFNVLEYNPTAFLDPLDSVTYTNKDGTTAVIPVISEFELYADTPQLISDSSVMFKEVTKCESIDELLRKILPPLWLAGTAIMAAYTAAAYIKIHLKVRNSVNLQENVYVCGSIDTPFVFGIIRPKIYIPHNISGTDLQYILAHENAHIQRSDHISKLLAALILSVHWFNPFVWLAFKLMTVDIEVSCDERALDGYNLEKRKEYAAALLNLSAAQNGFKPGAMLSFGESGIKMRIKSVLKIKKPTVIACIASAMVIVIAAVCLLTEKQSYPEIPSVPLKISDNLYENPDITAYATYNKVFRTVRDTFVISSDGLRESVFTMSKWKKLPYSQKEWTALTGNTPDISVYKEKYCMHLSEHYSIFSMDDEFWLVHTIPESEEHQESIWGVYLLEKGDIAQNIPVLPGSDEESERIRVDDGYEIRFSGRKPYLFIPDEPVPKNDGARVRRDRTDGSYDELTIPELSAFAPSYLYVHFEEITGDNVEDLIITGHTTGTGITSNGFIAVDSLKFSPVTVDYEAVEKMISELCQQHILPNENFNSNDPYLMGADRFQEVDEKYLYPYYPDKSIRRFGGMFVSCTPNGTVTGNKTVCLVRNETEFSDVYRVDIAFAHNNGVLVPVSCTLAKSEQEIYADALSKYLTDWWYNCLVQRGFDISRYFGDDDALAEAEEKLNNYTLDENVNGVGINVDYDTVQIGITDNGRTTVEFTYDLYTPLKDGTEKYEQHKAYFVLDNAMKITYEEAL